ncbi:MAG: PRC-barrel domain-containing protein, partial [Vicinamibacterales bacterium]
MDHPRPGLRFVNAKDLEDGGPSFAGLPVYGVDGEKLGEVEGFIIDVAEGRPRHIVVTAGWFIHKRFLLPIGHASIGTDGTQLNADITKERVRRFPGFERSEFEKLSAEDLNRLDQAMAAACTDEDE